MKYQEMPKIELHCHLDGSVRPETVIELAKNEGIKLESDDPSMVRAMMVAPMDCQSLDEYLQRFDLPISVMQSKDGLRRIAYEVMEDGARENVKYMEIRFAPLFHTEGGLNVDEIIKSVVEGIALAEADYDIKGNVILSCLRHMTVESVYDVIEAGKRFLGKGVVAIDLCGGEDDGFAKRYVEAFRLAKEYGYNITVHAGEAGCSQNVLDAIRLLGAQRIGHGVFIHDNPEARDIVREHRIALEVCPTSNVQTKAVASIEEHPIAAFHEAGIPVTINTDNRTVSDTTMSDEYALMARVHHFDNDDFRSIYENAVDAAFINEVEKRRLKSIK